MVSDFLELSTSSIALVAQVNDVAIDLSRGAICCWHANDLNQRLQYAVQLSANTKHADSIQVIVQKAEDESKILNAQLKKQTTKLSSLVDDIQQKMRAGKVISIISRIEASRAGEFRQALEEMADKVEALTEQMITHIQTAMKQLENAK